MPSMRPAAAAMLLFPILSAASATLAEQVTIPGERIDPSACGPSWIESMEAAIERDRTAVPPPNHRARNGRPGVWVVPSRDATTFPRSGDHNAVNKWGDTRMGIGFPEPVDVQGAWFAGQAGEGAWTPGLRVLGYRDGVLVGETDLFSDIDDEPAWLEMNLRGVDRIEIVALPAYRGGGWYGMDDLTYTPAATGLGRAEPRPVIVDFDDLAYRTKLTGSGYAGLTWETGTGDFSIDEEGVHGPLIPPGAKEEELRLGGPAPSAERGTLPELYDTFQGVLRGDAGSWSYPPDTDGAIGPDHYVETVNRNFAVYDKDTGAELINILLGSFLPGSNGDPRCVFDHHSGRWIIHVTDFSATATIFLAVSLTDDPTGEWFKTSFRTDQGSDAGRWPDYPTLGVDEYGIYIAAYMVPAGMSIFALDKAPLVDDPPELGTITAFRNLPWEGAIQPALTYGNPGAEYLISLNSSSSLRVRRVDPPLTNPTLTDLGTVSVSYFSDPPNAPALGSSVPLNTVDDRLMMSVYRDGSLWTAHTINVSGRAGCRWYEIDPESTSVIQEGTVADGSLYYFFPSIMVNQTGDAVMGFTGSNASQYAGCYYTGRLATDPPGEMAPPVMFKEGTGAQNNIDGYGRNRWGDYSYTTLDPLDQTTFWTIQEYGHDTDVWGTYLAVLGFGAPDCNENGIPDNCDIDCGPPGGECDVPGCGESEDCNGNGVPDECELEGNDCNGNGVPDECDIADGTSEDCNENGIPDECDIADGTSEDCQPNGIPDECEIELGEVVVAFFDLAQDPGWSTEGLWAFGQPTGGGGEHGGTDPTSGYTGPYVYGYNLNGDYENNLPERDLTTDAIDCSNAQEVHLSFRRWLGVEQPAYDHAYVRVSNDGDNWVTVWENGQEITDTSWIEEEYDISSVADGEETVYIRWTMGSTDGGWRYCGWNIDDIEIRGLSYVQSENDCQPNGVPDECDIADGTSEDNNNNGIPDECECTGDFDGDGDVDTADLLFLLGAWGDNPAGDLDGDGDTDTADLLLLLAAWGECP